MSSAYWRDARSLSPIAAMWACVLVAGFATFTLPIQRVEQDLIRGLLQFACVLGTLALCRHLHRRLTARIDPDGSRRRHVLDFGASTED